MNRKKTSFMLLIGILMIFLSFNVVGQDCNPPINFVTNTPHMPNWYSVQMSWDVPNSSKSSLIFSNGSIITHPGEGFNGADVSAMTDGATTIGFIGNHELNYSIADDFTLTGTTQIDSIQFYTIQILVPEPAPNANVKEVFIQIYDAAPNAGGQVIWGDMVTDRKKDVIFPNIYRVPGDNLQHNQSPVMRTTAEIGTSLNAGTYWLEVSVTSIINANPPQNARIILPPVTIVGEPNTGNALWKKNGVWQDMIDAGNNGHGGLAMDIYGSASALEYNVYRDDVKLTNTPIDNLTFYDVAPGAGSYSYGVTAVYPDECESEKVISTITFEQSPCETPTVVTGMYIQGFESGIPYCWSQEVDEHNQMWSWALGDVSEPSTAYNGSRKVVFQGNSGETTKLITEFFDITVLENPELGFWLAQKSQEGSQDELRVYYRGNDSAPWENIADYTTEVADWTWMTVELPTPSSTYQIAFEAKGNGGFGVMMDDIIIQEEGGAGCAAIQNLSFEVNPPEEEWYTINLSWDHPEGAMPGDANEVWDNGPFITHEGVGVAGADISSAENAADLGFNTDQISGYSVADDFTLVKSTHIDYMAFYLYEKYTIDNDPAYIDMLFIRIYDDSPLEGGNVIWGDTYTNRINRDLSSFSNIYRVAGEDFTSTDRPIMEIIADIDFTFDKGTYWVEIIAVSKVSPMSGGVIYSIPVTKIGEDFNGNAVQSYGSDWGPLMGSTGQCDVPFKALGKQMPLTYDIYRDGVKINSEPVISNGYTDVVSVAGTYEYCVKAVWNGGCVSDGVCVTIEMPVDPCETAISQYPYHEGFEGYDEETTLKDGCWQQEYVVVDSEHGYGWDWEVVDADISTPATAPEGTRKVIFYVGSGLTTKLISPIFDLSDLEKPILNFWHAQKEWFGDQNELRVYYKNSAEADWVLIKEWIHSVDDWTEQTLDLPAPTSNYRIAFESVGNLGHATMVDDITIDRGTVGTELYNMDMVKVYPNPANNQVSISGDDIARVEVYDIMGRLSKSISSGFSQINLFDLDNGVYLFKIYNSSNDVVIHRVVVNR